MARYAAAMTAQVLPPLVAADHQQSVMYQHQQQQQQQQQQQRHLYQNQHQQHQLDQRRHTPPPPESFAAAVADSGSGNSHTTTINTTTSALRQPADQSRTPRLARKAVANPDLDEIKAAVERDALRKEAKKAAQLNMAVTAARHQPADAADAVVALTPSSPSSPQSSPGQASTSTFTSIRPEPPHPMARNRSIDSTVSLTSSATSTPQSMHKSKGSTTSFKVHPESSRPEDIAALIASTGSPEAAIAKLIAEKNTAASHNAQLWRLVEKQRAMILGLNKDLEKTLKDKERYRRKLKENLQSQPTLPASLAPRPVDDGSVRDDSLSPSVAPATLLPNPLRDNSLDSRKVSDASDMRSDTPQDSINLGSSGLPSTPQSLPAPLAASDSGSSRNGSTPVPQTRENRPNMPAPLQLSGNSAPHGASDRSYSKPQSKVTSPASPQDTAQPFSSPKQTVRKAPPAPLQLSPLTTVPAEHTIVDASDSEYEDEPESARSDHIVRGRRKTREDDDRQREALAQKELESRSKSKTDKKSKSSKTPAEASTPSDSTRPSTSEEPLHPQEQTAWARKVTEPSLDDQALHSNLVNGLNGSRLEKSNTAPSLLTPGLPLSPRPGDRPLNSPMPRPPNKTISSIPMSPKSGMPLTPRAPTKPIPLPSRNPLATITSTSHLVRSEQYQQQMAQQPSIADRLRPTVATSVEREQHRSPEAHQPGHIYKGLVTEQYPDLLLPPHALPLVIMKVASSRMRPARHSVIVAKQPEENTIFTLGIYARSDGKQLWRVEKTLAALTSLDLKIKSVSPSFHERVPDKALFTGHAPAKIDARRNALNAYFNNMVDAVTDERAARVVCKFLSVDVIPTEGGSEHGGSPVEQRPDSPMFRRAPRREGYLTKRGKNFGGWKARYFVLDGPQLKYFEAPSGAHMGSIKLLNAQIGKQSQQSTQTSDDEDNQFRHAFLILEPKRKDSNSLVRHVLCAESDEERDAWVDALLFYVDSAGDENAAPVGPGMAPDSGLRGVRQQKSAADIRPSSGHNPTPSQSRYLDPMPTVGYNETIAGDAPLMGAVPITGARPAPSPSVSSSEFSTSHPQAHPTISGPTNATIIHNTGEWGLKSPPPPAATQSKDKMRSLFANLRGRSSSDLDPKEKPVSLGPQQNESSVRATFGIPLAEAVEFGRPTDVQTALPAVVYRCIEYLTAKQAIAEEGIFRLSGSNTVIKALRERFNAEGDVHLLAEDQYYDIHAVASLLKLYLRELPSSILTRELHLEFLQCLELSTTDKVRSLNVLVHRLPVPNFELLRELSAFLLSIVNNSDVNKMNVRNVGIVFAPTLNVPAPLISSFVDDQAAIFGAPISDDDSTLAGRDLQLPSNGPIDLRSPRKQMFSDLPTPAFNQTSFHPLGGTFHNNINTNGGMNGAPPSDTGFMPIHQSYASYQIPLAAAQRQGDGGMGGFASLSGALTTAPNGIYSSQPPPQRDTQPRSRESASLAATTGPGGVRNKASFSRMSEDGGTSFW